MAKTKTSTKATAKKTAAKKTATKKTTAKQTTASKESTKKTTTTKVKIKKGSDPTTEDIAARAYQIWQEQGCPMGTADANWHQAESELNGSPQV